MPADIPGMRTPIAPPRVLLWLLVFGALVLGMISLRPPSPLDATSSPDQFSAERALEHVGVIAAEPHPMGSPAIEGVRAYIAAELEQLGIAVEAQTRTAPNYFSPGNVDVVNLIARIPGAASTGTIVFVAHYDTHPATPGANDNSTAVAALMEAGRALASSPPLRNDVVLLFTDAEEPRPRYGSTAFVADYPQIDDVELAVNLEATGVTGASVLVETSGPEGWLIEELRRAEPDVPAFSFATELTNWLGDIGTDFDLFSNADIPGFHFVYTHGSSVYHTERDNLASVADSSLQDHGNHAINVARHFGELDFDAARPDSDAVFFPILTALVLYSPWVGILLAVVGAVAAVAGLMIRERRNPLGPRPIAGAAVAAAVIGGATVLWMVIAALRPTLGLIEGYVYFVAIVGAGASSVVMANRRLRGQVVVSRGPLLTLAITALLTAVLAPGFGYLFGWPLLAVAVALWIPADSLSRIYARFTTVALVTIVVTAPAVDIFLQMAHPRPGNPDSSMPVAAVIPVTLTLLTVSILRGFWPPAPEHS